MGGYIETSSRRCHFDDATYWSRENKKQDLSQFLLENKPKGTFAYKEASSHFKQKGEVSNLFLFDENTITIETNDEIEIKNGDLVLMDGYYWNVINVQETIKSRQYWKQSHRRKYIQLKR